jgi:tetratricopeptide (TPR) repeat protein
MKPDNSKNSNFFANANAMINELADYIKPLVLNTNDPELAAKKQQAYNLLVKGRQLLEQNDNTAAFKSYEEAISIFAAAKDDVAQGFARYLCADSYEIVGDIEKCLDNYNKAYELLKEKSRMTALKVEQKISALKIEHKLRG